MDSRRERASSSEHHVHRRHLSSPQPHPHPHGAAAAPPGAAAPLLLSPSGGAAPAAASAAAASPASSSAEELALLRQHSVLERDFGLHLFGPDSMERVDLPLPGAPHATVSLKTAAVAALFVVGTLFYRWAERLSWVDAAYCTAGVITTVGQVIVPRTVAGRCFTAAFNLASLGLGVLLIMEIADSRRDSARRLLRRNVRASLSPAALEVAALVAATVPPVLAMALAMMVLEGWPSFGEALYFCLICATGLGMGDVEPKRPISRVLFIVYIFQMMGLMLTLAGTVGNALHEALRQRAVGLSVASPHHAVKSSPHSDGGHVHGGGGRPAEHSG